MATTQAYVLLKDKTGLGKEGDIVNLHPRAAYYDKQNGTLVKVGDEPKATKNSIRKKK